MCIDSREIHHETIFENGQLLVFSERDLDVRQPDGVERAEKPTESMTVQAV